MSHVFLFSLVSDQRSWITMCSNDCNLTQLEKQAGSLKSKRTNCKKCHSDKVFVLLQKEHCYCRICFHEYCSHKFRSTIGKTRLVKKDDKVLVAVSGGTSSMAMLDMIQEGLSLENHHRRLQFIPILLFVDETCLLPNREESAIMRSYLASKPYDSYVVRLEKVFRSGDEGFVLTIGSADLQSVSSEEVNLLQSSMSNMTTETSKEEFIRRIRSQLIIDAAAFLSCDSIFIGSSGSRLAVQMIADVAIGRGNAVNEEIGFLDDRSEIPVLKPMREFVNKEIAYYLRLKNIEPILVKDILTKGNLKASIGKVTECFINSLEEDFPATTYSLCRISTKVQSRNDNRDVKCLLCNTYSDQISPDESSALSALRVSSRLCREEEDEGDCMTGMPLCYSCSQLVS